MKKLIAYMICALSLAVLTTACDDGIDIRQDYGFTVEHLPVPKRRKKGETAEIRLTIKREGRWDGAEYRMRYFQPDGSGILRYDDGTVSLPNDLYPLEREEFRFYYTSHSEESQTIDLYFIDNFGKMVTLTFSFNNKGEDDEKS